MPSDLELAGTSVYGILCKMEKDFKKEKNLLKEEVYAMSDYDCMNSSCELERESQKIHCEAKTEKIERDLLEKHKSKRGEFHDHVQVKNEPINEDTSEEQHLPVSYCDIECDIQVKSEESEDISNQTDDYWDDIIHGDDRSMEKYPRKGLITSYKCPHCQKIFSHKGNLQEHILTHTEKMPPTPLSTSETHKKRCRKSVTLETKLEVLRRIEAGEKIVEICNAMGLAKSTIQTIRDKKEDIKSYLQSAAPLNASRLTRQRNWIMEKMEKLLIIWIEDNNKRRMPMSVMTIQEKALRIFKNLKNGGTDESADEVTFQASRGWFEKFKNRFHLNNLKIKGEAAIVDEVASKEYPNIIGRGGYKTEQVLNLDKTGLYWKRMPVVSKQLTSKNLSKAFSYFEQGINILLENDRDVERSAKVSREICSAISCYKLLKNEIDMEARKTTLDNFAKPDPSLPAKNDDDSDLEVTISLPP